MFSREELRTFGIILLVNAIMLFIEAWVGLNGWKTILFFAFVETLLIDRLILVGYR